MAREEAVLLCLAAAVKASLMDSQLSDPRPAATLSVSLPATRRQFQGQKGRRLYKEGRGGINADLFLWHEFCLTIAGTCRWRSPSTSFCPSCGSDQRSA